MQLYITSICEVSNYTHSGKTSFILLNNFQDLTGKYFSEQPDAPARWFNSPSVKVLPARNSSTQETEIITSSTCHRVAADK